MHRGIKYIITFLLFWLAIIGYISLSGTITNWDCENLKKGTMEVIRGGTLGPGYGGRNNLRYFGKILETGKNVHISPKSVYKVHPDLRNDINLVKKFRSGDTTFLLTVYNDGSGKASLNIPKDCIDDAVKTRKLIIIRILIIIFLLLPLPLWIIIGIIKYINNKKLTFLLLFTLASSFIQGQEIRIDTTPIYTVEVYESTGIVYKYPDNTFITKSNFNVEKYTLKYPEETLKYMVSAVDTATLNRAFENGANTFISNTNLHVKKISSMDEMELFIQPTFKIQYKEDGKDICLIKFFLVDSNKQRSFRSLVKCVNIEGTWKIMASPMPFDIAVAIASTKDDVLWGLITGETEDTYLQNLHEKLVVENTFSFIRFAFEYNQWFENEELNQIIIEKYTENIIK